MTTTIASTIASQIGNRSLRMIGAKDLIDMGSGLRFKIRGSKVVNMIEVTLDADDTYTMTFSKITGRAHTIKVATVAEFSMIYADQLNTLIESTTGLYTRI